MSFIRTRLSVMMFLEFLIWGAWYPLVFGYLPALGFDSNEQFWILSGFNFAAIVAMFFSTQFADRNFAAERFLAVSQLIGGIAMICLAGTTHFWPLLLLMYRHFEKGTGTARRDALHFRRRGRSLDCARRVQPLSAAHAAQARRCRREPVCVARSGQAAESSVHAGAVRRHVHRRDRAPVLFLL